MEPQYDETSITTLSPSEHVRMRPTMYFSCFEEGSLDMLPIEVMCHAIDEYFDGKCAKIRILMGEDSFELSYDAGMPLRRHGDICAAEGMMTQIMTCHNVKKHLHVGEKHCQTGMAIINFATERSTLSTVCDGERGEFTFEKGITISRSIEPAPGEPDSTVIFMKLDPVIFGDLRMTYEGVCEHARKIEAELPGLEIEVVGD